MRNLLCLLYIFLSLIFSPANYAANSNEELLPAEQAFYLQVSMGATQTLEFYWQISPGYYLYKDQLSLLDAQHVELDIAAQLPPGIVKHDPDLGDYTVYADALNLHIPWQERFKNSDLLLRYQGCNQSGFCYAPIYKLIHIDNALQITVTDTTEPELNIANPNTDNMENAEVDKLAATIKNRFLPLTLIIFFMLGILLSFSPCVLPMIPLVVNLIIGPKPISTHKALLLSGSYVLGMAGSYALAGMLVGSLGATFQGWFQQPIILISLAIFLVFLALAQFEMIKIKLPHFNRHLHHWSQKQLQGSLGGAFILGIIAALVVSPCVTAPLIGVLTYIGQNGNPAIGAITLFSLGLGMGVPLILVALLSSVILPAAGVWMNVIKKAAGIALLGLAIWILGRVLSTEITLILWGLLCIITALLFKAFEPLRHANKATKILKGSAIILAIFGSVLIANAITNKYNQQSTLTWHNINTKQELDNYLASARAQHQATILEFYANWCTSCRKIDASVINDPQVQQQLRQFSLLRTDISDITPEQQELLQSLQVFGPPTIIFFNSNGVEITQLRIVGEVDVATLIKELAQL